MCWHLTSMCMSVSAPLTWQIAFHEFCNALNKPKCHSSEISHKFYGVEVCLYLYTSMCMFVRERQAIKVISWLFTLRVWSNWSMRPTWCRCKYLAIWFRIWLSIFKTYEMLMGKTHLRRLVQICTVDASLWDRQHMKLPPKTLILMMPTPAIRVAV